MSEKTQHTEKLGEYCWTGGEAVYTLFADIQKNDTGGWITYFYFALDDWESLRQPSFAYGGATLDAAIGRVHELADIDEEYLLDALMPY